MEKTNNKASGGQGKPSGTGPIWSPGMRTQSWDALWRRILSDVLHEDGDATESETHKGEGPDK